MNTEKAMILYDALTGIREDYVEASAKPCPMRPVALVRRGVGVLAACFVLGVLTLLGLMYLGVGRSHPIGPTAAGGGSGEGATYQAYAGPIFPLTAAEGGETLSASRRTTLDFTPYREAGRNVQTRYITVTDEYLLTNTGKEDRSYELCYPVALDIFSEREPAFTVDGAAVTAEKLAGPDTDGSGRAVIPMSWEDYRVWLEEDDLSRALADAPSLEIPVTVYELTDRWGTRTEEAKRPTLALDFTVDPEKTAVLSYGFTGSVWEPETGWNQRKADVPRTDSAFAGESAWLLVLGEDIGSYRLEAYTDGSCTTPMAEAGGTVLRYESTLGEMLARMQEIEVSRENDWPEKLREGSLARDLIARHWAEIGLLTGEYGRFWQAWNDWTVEEAFSGLRRQRVIYWHFTLRIPAGESRLVTVRSVKQPSYDHVGSRRDLSRNGYDMVTRLGSTIRFTEQAAALEGAEYITILDQNFGFDPEKGILEVTLDPARERYFLEVEKKETE